MLSVQVSDFGPIVSGRVTLKPLTVFVGRNNSGKSYLAMLLYALHRVLGPNLALLRKRPQAFRPHRFFPPTPLYYHPRRMTFSESEINSLSEWLETLAGEKEPHIKLALDHIPDKIRDILGRVVDQHFSDIVLALDQELQRCYGADIAELTRGESEAKHFSLLLKETERHWSLDVTSPGGKLKLHSPALDFSAHPLTVPSRRIRPRARQRQLLEDERFELAFDTLYEPLMTSIRRNLPVFTYYFPAARSGILHSHKILARFLVTQSPLVGLQRIELPQLSGVITDFIGNLLTLETRRKTPLYPIASFLEQSVIGGQVSMEATKVEYPQIIYEAGGGKYPLHRTSSMVSELAPVILLLKYIIEPDDFLIIEEPESHLHPASQRKLASCIAKLLRQEVKILITTHSDYFLSQLSNFVRLSQLDPSVRKSQGFNEDTYIKPEEVGAYLFDYQDDKKGSVIRELTITAEEGISDEEFAGVTQDLYEETIRLQR